MPSLIFQQTQTSPILADSLTHENQALTGKLDLSGPSC